MNFIKRFFVMRKFKKELEKMRADPVLYYRNRKDSTFCPEVPLRKCERCVGIYCYLKSEATDQGRHGILLSDGSVEYLDPQDIIEQPRISHIIYDTKKLLQALGIHYTSLLRFKDLGMPVICGSRYLFTEKSVDWIAENYDCYKLKIEEFKDVRFKKEVENKRCLSDLRC